MRLLPLLLIMALVLGVAACGGDDDDSSPTVRTPTSPSEDGNGDSDPTEPPATHTPEPDPTATPEPSTPTAEPTSGGGGSPGDGNGNNGDVEVLPCDNLAPVDKEHRLPEDCEPSNLVALPTEYTYDGEQVLEQETASRVIELIDAAAEDDIELKVRSAYRSYNTQVSTFNYWVDTLGWEEAVRVSAQPGHSEHQLGTTADLTGPNAGYTLDGMVGTPEAAWIEENAHTFGFIVSYPQGMEDVTGYVYEPWHIRYVGNGIAAEVNSSNLTLAEFLHRR